MAKASVSDRGGQTGQGNMRRAAGALHGAFPVLFVLSSSSIHLTPNVLECLLCAGPGLGAQAIVNRQT